MDSKQVVHRPGGTGNPDRSNIMSTTIRVTQDERNQHAVIITHNGEDRIYSRHYSAHVISATAAAVRRDGNAVQCWEESQAAEYRTTKAGKRLLLSVAA
jgi:hypothetical protein